MQGTQGRYAVILQVINVGDGFAEIVSPPTSGLRAALKLIAGAYFKARR